MEVVIIGKLDTINTITLDVSAIGGEDYMTPAVQFDTNTRIIQTIITDKGVPMDLTGVTPRLYVARPPDPPEFLEGVVQPETGHVNFTLTNDALSQFGLVEAQVQLWADKDKAILTAPLFNILVNRSIADFAAIEGTNEYGALVVLFSHVANALELMETMVNQIGTPGELAQQLGLTTMWKAWEWTPDYIENTLTPLITEAINNGTSQGVLNRIGTAGAVGSTTVMGKLNILLGQSNVKQILRGVTKFSAGNTAEVSINVVNIRKSIVLIDGQAGYGSLPTSGERWVALPFLLRLEEKRIVFGRSADAAGNDTFSWQLVEFV